MRRVWLPLLAALALPALAIAAAVATSGDGAGGAAGRVDVLGDPIPCPGGGQAQSRFILDGENFQATGTLKALNSDQVVVAGPSGDVTMAASVNVDIRDSVQAGDVVTAEGQVVSATGAYVASVVRSACTAAALAAAPAVTPAATPAPSSNTAATGGEATCKANVGRLQLNAKVHKQEVQIERARVVSFENGDLTIQTPVGDLTVTVKGDTKVKGDLKHAGEVTVTGAANGKHGIVAQAVQALCRAGDSGNQQSDVEESSGSGNSGEQNDDQSEKSGDTGDVNSRDDGED